MAYYPPQSRGTNPLVYVLAACGGCVVLALIFIFGLGLFVSHRIGGVVQEAVTVTKFAAALQQHNYPLASSLLTGTAKQEYTPAALQQKMASLEKKYGPFDELEIQQNYSATYPSDRQKSNSLQMLDYPCNLIFQKATVQIKLHFDPNDPSHISSITWGSVFKKAPSQQGGNSDTRS